MKYSKNLAFKRTSMKNMKPVSTLLMKNRLSCLTYWNKNVWSLGSKNAFEHKFWLKNSALRATCIISINKKDPVYFSDFINLCSHIVLLLVIVYLLLLTFIISLLLHSLIYRVSPKKCSLARCFEVGFFWTHHLSPWTKWGGFDNFWIHSKCIRGALEAKNSPPQNIFL